jgi:hypothetical protein
MDLTQETIRVPVLLYQAEGLIAAAIRWQTRSPWSHAALVLNGDLYEAREGRLVARRPLTRADAEATWFTVTVTVEQYLAMLAFAEEQLGKGYDYTMVARFLSRRQASRASSLKWFCSEYVFAIFHHAGLDLLARTECWEVSPGLLGRSPLLQPAHQETDPWLQELYLAALNAAA